MRSNYEFAIMVLKLALSYIGFIIVIDQYRLNQHAIHPEALNRPGQAYLLTTNSLILTLNSHQSMMFQFMETFL